MLLTRASTSWMPTIGWTWCNVQSKHFWACSCDSRHPRLDLCSGPRAWSWGTSMVSHAVWKLYCPGFGTDSCILGISSTSCCNCWLSVTCSPSLQVPKSRMPATDHAEYQPLGPTIELQAQVRVRNCCSLVGIAVFLHPSFHGLHACTGWLP